MREAKEAGRELDAEIAKQVFEYWDVEMYEGKLVHGESNMNGWPMPTPNYSTSIADAWLVVEHMADRGWKVDVQNRFPPTWACHVAFPAPDYRHIFETADSVALAICLAALQGVAGISEGAEHG
jgi:hypothetical protein